MPSNSERAAWAASCIEHFRSLAGDGMSDYEALMDLISDLGHWALNGADFSPERGKDFQIFTPDKSDAYIFVHAVEIGLGQWSAEERDPDDEPKSNNEWVCIEVTDANRGALLDYRPDDIDVTKGEAPADDDEEV